MLEKTLRASLILENGMVFEGRTFGHSKEAVGEIVFTTNTTGYQEALSDPAHAGKILLFTYPLVGNYGINLDDMESSAPRVKAVIVREKCNMPNSWRCEMELDGYMKQNKIVGIEGIDTRAVMRSLRDNGSMKGIINIRGGELTESLIKSKFESSHNKTAVRDVTRHEKKIYEGTGIHIGIIDLGVKNSFIEALHGLGCKLTVFPAFAASEEILSSGADAIVIPDGAGSPFDIPSVSEEIKKIAGKIPLAGFGLGHHVLTIALGGAVKKMRFGHHGGNYPVKDLQTGRIYIVSQNNDYEITKLPENAEATFRNVNDGIIEGYEDKERKILSVQFSPEILKSPNSTEFIFQRIMGCTEK